MDEEEAISKEEADRQAEKEVSGDNSIKTVDAYHSDRELATVDVNKLAQSSSAIYESEVAAEQQKQLVKLAFPGSPAILCCIHFLWAYFFIHLFLRF